MIHDDEADFHRAVRAWLADAFEIIEHEPVLSSGRRPDFIARTPFESYVLEVESTGDRVYEAIGQAGTYSVETGYEPVVVYPAHDPPDADPFPDWVTVVMV